MKQAQEKPMELGAGRCLLVEKPLVLHARLESEVCVLLLGKDGGGPAAIGCIGKISDARGILERMVGAFGGRTTLRAKVVAGGNPIALLETVRSYLSEKSISLVAEECSGPEPRELFAVLPEGRLRISQSPPQRATTPAPSLAKTPKARRRVMVVEDTKTIRQLVEHILSRETDLELVAQAESAEQALELLPQCRPDVILLDINLPGMNGLTFLERLTSPADVAVVIMSSINPESGKTGLRAFELGAFEYIEKPSLSDMNRLSAELVDNLRNAVPVESCRSRAHVTPKVKKSPSRTTTGRRARTAPLVAVGASTGGTNAIREFFRDLPADVPPIVVVQHIPPIFSKAFAEELNRLCAFEVKEAEDGDVVKSGRALIAPGGRQMLVEKQGPSLRVRLNDDPPVNRHRPSVDYLFDSVAELGLSDVVAFLLTGMGADGASGLLHLRNRGAKTFAQDEQSCVVYGMPRAAVEMGAAQSVLPLGDMADAFVRAAMGREP